MFVILTEQSHWMLVVLIVDICYIDGGCLLVC